MKPLIEQLDERLHLSMKELAEAQEKLRREENLSQQWKAERDQTRKEHHQIKIELHKQHQLTMKDLAETEEKLREEENLSQQWKAERNLARKEHQQTKIELQQTIKLHNMMMKKLAETEEKLSIVENLSQQWKAKCDQTKREHDNTIIALQQTIRQRDNIQKEYDQAKIELQQTTHLMMKRLAETEEKLGRQENLSQQYKTECVQTKREHDNTRIELQQAVKQLDHVQNECDQAKTELEALKEEHSKCRAVWIVPRHQVTVLDASLGGGAWGYVRKGSFRGQQVAVKCIHESIITQATIKRVYREICTMAQVHHPNLVQFIAAVLDDQGEPMIITELMDTTLRKAYEDNLLKPGLAQCVAILGEVASALSYLHELEAPIIHRDVNSANVLLKAMAQDKWKAKLSDFGSANWAKQASTMGEGAIVYTAPEAYPLHPSLRHTPPPPQTTKIDVYSYGILLCEITLRKFPDPDRLLESQKELKVKHVRLHSLMVRCTHDEPTRRPSMADVLKYLDDISRK